ncbi:adenine phosphoribosyltransferase [Mycoplasmoides pneumoniae]|uniref:adenine phosphoribosyltransferase n=1 Tax=Mycoplasmoides pneumoniae TaxID=2104 RepID=UPI000A2A3AED|nr:adenine phosphoribosyltransferase [Mycoplasmoides pneumoniae]ARQ40210.1 adenine phosphoribosyltransferase [Mycoplasmoides pneumoniae]
MKQKLQALDRAIKRFNDFPTPGILFYDITPIFLNSELFEFVLEQMAQFIQEVKADGIVCPEARGFIFGGALASKTKLPLVLVRKPHKLSGELARETYDLEYRQNSILEMRVDALENCKRCVIVDDLLATAGTVAAINKLIARLGSQTVGYCFLIELQKLHGKAKLQPNVATKILLHY